MSSPEERQIQQVRAEVNRGFDKVQANLIRTDLKVNELNVELQKHITKSEMLEADYKQTRSLVIGDHKTEGMRGVVGRLVQSRTLTQKVVWLFAVPVCVGVTLLAAGYGLAIIFRVATGG